MKASRSAPPGSYPDLHAEDVLFGGNATFWRNPARRPFDAQDAWTLSVAWRNTSELAAAYRKLETKEKKLAAQTEFAWDSDFGYLSPNPEHCGTALCFEGEFHLEALNLIGDLPAVLNAVDAVRFKSASIIEDGIRQAAHLFRISNAATLGVSEDDLLARANRLFSQLVTQETNARRSLVEDTPRILEDSVARALAVLRSARLLSPGELLDMLSPVRLAASMGFLDGITRDEVHKLMQIQIEAPELPPSRTADDDRRRDARDARLADRINARFKSVGFSRLATSHLF